MKIATFALLLLIVSVECWNLTESENQMRLRNCGRQMLETPQFPNNSIDPISIEYPQNGFIVTVMVTFIDYLGNFTIENGRALGTFISPRHILTVSQPVMTSYTKWVWNEEVNMTAVENDFLRVPLESMSNTSHNDKLVVRLQSDTNPWSGVDFEVENAWIYIKHQPDIPLMRNPMIITLKTDHPNVNFPCLVKNSTALNVTQMMHIYGLNESNPSALDYRFLPITEFANDKRWIHTERYGFEADKGGPMIAEIDGKVKIVGMSAFTPSQYFYDLRALNDQICHLSGVCNLEDHEIWNITTAVPTTTILPLQNATSPSVPSKNVSNIQFEDPTMGELDGSWYTDDVDHYEVDADFLSEGNTNFFGFFAMVMVLVIGWMM